MDRLKFFSLTRRHHFIDNPISEAKLDRVVDVLNLRPGALVLDIASGKGELVCRIAAKYGAHCTGVDLNPASCADAEIRARDRGLSALIEIRNQAGQDFEADVGKYDAAMCVGAEWIFGGWKETISRLASWTQAGGTIVGGTPFWIQKPTQAYLAILGMPEDSFSSHAGNVATGEALGLTLVYSLTSEVDDWDHYSGLSWVAADEYIREHPDDPDDAEIAALIEKDKRGYFGGGRDCLGWGIYVFRK